jgi:hypothetical protein
MNEQKKNQRAWNLSIAGWGEAVKGRKRNHKEQELS